MYTVTLKTVQPPTCLSFKIVFKLICLDNVQYLAEHLTAAQLCLPKAVYTRDIRSVIINFLICREVSGTIRK